MKVSVIMPVYNAQAYVGQAIESVLKQQVEMELIIIDDASTDKTIDILKKYKGDKRVFIITNKKNMGVCKSRNVGTAMAKGEYIAFLDADDWWDETKLKKQLQLMKEKQCDFCYTGRELYKEDGTTTGKVIEVPERLDFKKLLCTNYIPCSSVLLKAKIAKEIPMEHDEIHEDYLAWLRMIQKCGYAYGINQPLLKSRLTENGKSRKKRRTFKMTYGVYRYIGNKPYKAVYYTTRHLYHSFFRYFKWSKV